MNNTFNAGSDVIDGQYISRYIWNVEHSEVINSNIKEVWEIISKERNLESFHPFCSRNVIERWGDHQSKDRIEYLNGLVYYREFCFWSENTGYDLFIKDLKGNSSFVSWRLTEGDNRCSLSITVYPYIFNMGNKIFNAIPFTFYIRPRLKNYLRSVIKGLEWHMENNIPIQKNYFGKHPWFS